MLKMDELRSLSPEELSEKANNLKKDLMQFRFQAKTGKLERQTAMKEVRRDIARVLTAMSEIRIGEAAPPPPAPQVVKIEKKRETEKKSEKKPETRKTKKSSFGRREAKS